MFAPRDFLDLGSRDAVDRALTRLCAEGTPLKVARGLYALPIDTAVDMAGHAYAKEPASPPPAASVVAIADPNGVFTFGIPKAGTRGFACLRAGPVKEHEGREKAMHPRGWRRLSPELSSSARRSSARAPIPSGMSCSRRMRRPWASAGTPCARLADLMDRCVACHGAHTVLPPTASETARETTSR